MSPDVHYTQSNGMALTLDLMFSRLGMRDVIVTPRGAPHRYASVVIQICLDPWGPQVQLLADNARATLWSITGKDQQVLASGLTMREAIETSIAEAARYTTQRLLAQSRKVEGVG